MKLAVQFSQKGKKMGARGFTLIEMAMVMVIMGIIISIMMTVMPALIKTGKIKEARAVLKKYDLVLQGYAFANFRLPFADNTEDGLEDDNVFVGNLPFQTLGMTHGNDVWGQPVKYSVNGTAGGADNFTTSVIEVPATTIEDTFKANMDAAAVAAFNQNIVYITSSDTCGAGIRINQAYVLVSGGAKDMDGGNGYFDLCNGVTGVGFNADNKIQAEDYDDIVRPMPIAQIRAKFQ